jgi:hypothetical protein
VGAPVIPASENRHRSSHLFSGLINHWFCFSAPA